MKYDELIHWEFLWVFFIIFYYSFVFVKNLVNLWAIFYLYSFIISKNDRCVSMLFRWFLF